MNNFLKLLLIFLSLFSFTNQIFAQEGVISEEELAEIQAYYTYVDSVEKAMNWDTAGTTVSIADGIASIQIPEGFKYLNPEQSSYVLKDVYGNPHGESLGLLYPANTGIFADSSYFVAISYDESGYISDEDAQDMDYEELLEEMKEDTRASSEERVKQGYESIQLLDWASAPYYDEASKKLHWAKSIQFGDSDSPTLNYNLLALGRHGYLELNFVADIAQLDEVKVAIPELMPSVNFNDGYRYEEFDSSIDKVAAYGIGGLIAGKVLAKTGFFALIAKFGKVIFVGIAAALGGLWKKFRGNA
ncbi:DUF2167 domain-containing protein [Sediminitomix flava]|uniref:Putative membrane-anchored protein n=1 Tax=Sediminitomix flava TaxID=379075 RepID=A0A315Z285_SEDFL|nr:DUF2167 domain-containing protein [Sediminitomix flava]PWJ36110.1 putative membrane-anchored protein [Sediminitomix flava]